MEYNTIWKGDHIKKLYGFIFLVVILLMSMCITAPEVEEPYAEISNEEIGEASYYCEIALHDIEFFEVFYWVWRFDAEGCGCKVFVSDDHISWYAYREVRSKDESITYCVFELIDLNCSSVYNFQLKYSDEDFVKHTLIHREFRTKG